MQVVARTLCAQVSRRATPRVQVVLQLHLRELAQRIGERRGPALAHQQAIQAAQEIHPLRAAELGERREHLEQRRHALHGRKRIHFREHGFHRVQELDAELLADVGELQLARFGLTSIASAMKSAADCAGWRAARSNEAGNDASISCAWTM